MLNRGALALLLAATASLAVAGNARVRPSALAIAAAPPLAVAGPASGTAMLVMVDLATQRLTLYRDGEPIAASPVSTGRSGYATPRGVFTILQKARFHLSNQYSNAPMPWMQRLTWQGVALHAGQLPGYPASHGCIRLPPAFAQRLFAETRLGATVVVADPRVLHPIRRSTTPVDAWWRPGLAARGPLTIVVSGADRRMIVLRDGVQIGSAPVAFDGAIARIQAYVLRADSGWTRVMLPGDRPMPRIAAAIPAGPGFGTAQGFERALGAALGPGATMLVVPDSLAGGIGAVAAPVELSGADELLEEWLVDRGVTGGR